ncbi:MAG: hypothetical protein RL092_1902 [Bacteroidota bacterium]
MKYITSLIILFCTLSILVTAQPQGRMGKGEMKGKAYGKIFDALSGKPIEFVVIRVYKEDSLTVTQQNFYWLICL